MNHIVSAPTRANFTFPVYLHTQNSVINVAGCRKTPSYHILAFPWQDSHAVRPELTLATTKHQRALWEKKSQRSPLTIYTNLASRDLFSVPCSFILQMLLQCFLMALLVHACVLLQEYTHKSLRAI